jgi:hypothetical protein
MFTIHYLLLRKIVYTIIFPGTSSLANRAISYKIGM